jgi:predicted  nucleic acid-binding Zn-ribbon protein
MPESSKSLLKQSYAIDAQIEKLRARKRKLSEKLAKALQAEEEQDRLERSAGSVQSAEIGIAEDRGAALGGEA